MFSRTRLGPRKGGQHSYTGKMCQSYFLYSEVLSVKPISCILLFAKRDQKIIFVKSEKSERVRIPYRSAIYWLATSNHPELSLALREVLISFKYDDPFGRKSVTKIFLSQQLDFFDQ